MKQLNRGRKPPSSDGSGRWEYPVAPGVMLHASTEKELSNLIFDFRLRNGIANSDIEADIDAYYCRTWPQSCHDTGQNRGPRRTELIDRITQWVTILGRAMPRGGYKLVEKDIAETRAAACQGCPNNQSWRGGCAGCTSAVSQMLVSLRQMRKTTRDGNLLACAELGHDNLTAAHLPAPEITDDQRARLPDRCWLKTK